MGFRDVIEVNGSAVPDRSGRLEQLFTKPMTDSTFDLAQAIADEGARFNLGPVSRNLNYPTMALMFLRLENQNRSEFLLRNSERVGGVRTSIIAFRETRRPTLVGSRQGNVIASGRFWIEPSTGRVRRTELIVQERLATGTYRADYGLWPDLPILAPISLDEMVSIHSPAGAEMIHGAARYSGIKRFTVEVLTTSDGGSLR
jgi:hypothetical protein